MVNYGLYNMFAQCSLIGIRKKANLITNLYQMTQYKTFLPSIEYN